MRNSHLFLVWLVVFTAACECRPRGATSVSGEVRWEWETPTGIQSDSFATVTFPVTPMGARREQVLWVTNVGRAPFTMSDLALVSGSPVTLGFPPVEGAAFEIKWNKDAVVNPSDRQQVTVIFAPPILMERSVEYASELELLPSGAPKSPLTINGRSIAGECDVPEVIDFGAVPIGTKLDSRFSIANDAAATILVSAGMVTGPAAAAFELDGLGNNRQLYVDPGQSPEVTVRFNATEPRQYEAEVTVRRGLSCPQKTIQLRGRGVTSCLTWVADPAADSTGIALHFGSVQPGTKKPGTVTFKNACGLDIELAGLRTSDPVFAVTAANPNDATTLLVPKATRDANMVWTDGTAVASLEFRPVALGPKQGQFNADSSLPSQSLVSVLIKGFGGGPKIDVRPSPVFSIGRVGFTPGASPGSSAQRTLRVSNVGNRPTPPDPRANLYLGVDGQGTNYFSVRAITGSIDELCVGEWDLAANDCAGTLSVGQYDPTVGLEAVAGQALHLPVRVIPSSAGPKEWELTIFSNDTASPATVVRITAEAVAAPPCNYSVTPTNLNFGVMDVPQMKELTFTLRNLGTTPTEICFFNGLGLSPQSNAMYSLVGAPTDFELAPSTNQVVTVRAAPTMSPTAPTMVPGAVLFNVSTPGASQGVVMLQTTLAPSCISVTPNPANFTDTELACGSPDRAITITNNCSTSVTLNSTVLTNTASAPNGTGGCTGTGCQQFVVTSAPPAGPIAAGASRVALVRFRPYVLGPIQGELTMTLQQGSNVMPYAVPLAGNGRARTSANCGVSAVCPGPITTNANSTVTLTPTVMSSGAATCQWSVGSRPATSSSTFTTPTSCTSTRYFADVVGTHVVDFTVSDGFGSTSQCSVPITVNPNGDLWIELTWDRPNDMDLHLLHPSAGNANLASSWGNLTWDCHWRNETPTWNSSASSPSLDRDDITGQGPENVRINSPSFTTTYTVGVHMYSWSASPSAINSTVKVYCAGQLVATRNRTMNRVNDMWIVGTINFGSGTPCTFTTTNTIVANVP